MRFLIHCLTKNVAKGRWFCGRECETIHATLQDLVNNGQNIVPESLMSVLKRKPKERYLPDDAEANVQWQLLSGKDYEDKKMEEKILLRKASLFFQVGDSLKMFYLLRKKLEKNTKTPSRCRRAVARGKNSEHAPTRKSRRGEHHSRDLACLPAPLVLS